MIVSVPSIRLENSWRNMSCLLTAHANSLHGTIETMSRKLKCSHAKSNAAKRKEDECDSVTIRGSRIVERKNVVKTPLPIQTRSVRRDRRYHFLNYTRFGCEANR